MLTRMEIANMSDTALRIAYDGTAQRLVHDLNRGNPGKLTDVYDLALMRLEADLRSLALSPVNMSRQEVLF